ncbi:hypothetical protein BS17DRAFT_768930 [Gyrodon lividus]|nr:hypothetical protein BS17DRAFT_768930 [Gyrodon lividus]
MRQAVDRLCGSIKLAITHDFDGSRDVLVVAILSSTLESPQKTAHDTMGDKLPHDFLTTLSNTDRRDSIRFGRIEKAHAALSNLPEASLIVRSGHQISPSELAFNRVCNYACHFYFHTQTNTFLLTLDEAKRALRLLACTGMQKLNISGGEPFLQPRYIGEVFKYCDEELGIDSCSIKWLDTYGQYLDVLSISRDSFDPETNIKQGHAENGTSATYIANVFKVVQWIKERGTKAKIIP